jgi:simple sugar transport system ATP-binding protein
MEDRGLGALPPEEDPRPVTLGRGADAPVDAEVVLEGINLRKSFGAVKAVDGVSIQLRRGHVTALIGDNGAGKSTLVNMLSGAIRPDHGLLVYRGRELTLSGPRAARRLGIETVWQTLALSREFDVASNVFLGRELVRFPKLGLLAPLKFSAMRQETEVRLRALGTEVAATSGVPARKLSGGQQQAVAIAKAAGWATNVLFMDEPTAALGVRQSAKVLSLGRQLANRGLAVAIISHSIPQVLEVADNVVVLRHGRTVADMPAKSATAEKLIALMLGFEPGLSPSDAPSADA